VADAKIVINATLTGDASAKLSDLLKDTEGLQKAAEKTGSAFSDFGNVAIGVFAGNVLTKGFDLATKAALSLADALFTGSIKAASEAEKATNDLALALNASGKFSQDAVKSFKDFASSLQDTTKFEDDAIVSTGALIARLTNLSGDALEDATRAAVNLSAALGKDLDSSATLVAKSLNGNEEALKKVGINLKFAKDEATDVNAVLQALGKFSGSAAGQLATFDGATARVANQFGELQETIGELITKNPAVIALINATGEGFAKLVDVVSKNRAEVAEFISSIAQLAGQAFPLLIDGLSAVSTAASEVSGFFGFITTKATEAYLKLSGASKEAIEANARIGEEEELQRQKSLRNLQMI